MRARKCTRRLRENEKGESGLWGARVKEGGRAEERESIRVIARRRKVGIRAR